MDNKNIAFVTFSLQPQCTADDQLLKHALEQQGKLVTETPWDNPHIEWEQFDSIILRSCWNYHTRLPDFLEWIDKIEQQKLPLWNPPLLIRWNARKTYLFDLEKTGTKIIPSILISKESPTSLLQLFEIYPWESVVVKPVVGASSQGIFRVQKEEARTKQWKLDTLLDQGDCLIQPFLQEINNGEVSIMFFKKQYSHTVLKLPAHNDFRVNRSFSKKVSPFVLTSNILDQAKAIIESIPDPWLYARIDGVIQGETLLLMELELIEPILYFSLNPDSIMDMTEAITSNTP